MYLNVILSIHSTDDQITHLLHTVLYGCTSQQQSVSAVEAKQHLPPHTEIREIDKRFYASFIIICHWCTSIRYHNILVSITLCSNISLLNTCIGKWQSISKCTGNEYPVILNWHTKNKMIQNMSEIVEYIHYRNIILTSS